MGDDRLPYEIPYKERPQNEVVGEIITATNKVVITRLNEIKYDIAPDEHQRDRELNPQDLSRIVQQLATVTQWNEVIMEPIFRDDSGVRQQGIDQSGNVWLARLSFYNEDAYGLTADRFRPQLDNNFREENGTVMIVGTQSRGPESVNIVDQTLEGAKKQNSKTFNLPL